MRHLRLLPFIIVIVALAACERDAGITAPRATGNAIAVAPGPLAVTLGPTVPSPAGLVACWAADGDATEIVGKNDATLSPAGVSFATGRFGRAFSFDSLGGDVMVPANASIDVGQGDGLTFSAWIFPKGPVFGPTWGSGPILEFENGAAFWAHFYLPSFLVDADSALFASLVNGGNPDLILQVDRVLALNAWNQVAVTYSRLTGSMALFVNGQRVALRNVGSFAAGTAAPLHIGSRPPGSFGSERYTFNGLIDELQIYDRDLAAGEIAQLGGAQGSMCVAPPTQFRVTRQPGTTAESGVPLSPQPIVTLLDETGTTVSNGSLAVTASLAPGSTGTLLGTTTVTAVAGVATFTDLAIAGSGPSTLQFSVNGLPNTGAATPATVVTQVPRKLGIRTAPDGAASGALLASQPVIEIRDQAGLLVPGAVNVVTASVAPAPATLSGSPATAIGGVASFSNLRITGAGTVNLTFSSVGLSSVSASLTVAPGAPEQLAVFAQPGGSESGLPLSSQPAVQVRDGFGTPLPAATNAVTVAIASGTGILRGTLTVNAVNGIATFSNLAIDGSGPVTLRFSATGLTAATSAGFTVAQVVRQMVITSQPATSSSGGVLTPPPTIELRDAAGLRITTATDQVTAAIASGSGTLSGTLTVSAIAGVATFGNLVVTGTGTSTLSFSAANGVTVTSGILLDVVEPTTATQLGILTQPVSAVSGVGFSPQPSVEVRDASGARVTTAGGTVTVSLGSGAGALLGTPSANIVGGVATFNDLRIAGGGPHSLSFASAGLTGVTSGTFPVTQVAQQLAIIVQPGDANYDDVISPSPVVELRDAAGLRVTTATNPVTVSIATGSGLLGGTTTVAAAGGRVTFPDLRIYGAGAFTVRFSSAGLTSATSASFNAALTRPYAWDGFFDPIDNPPAVNRVNSGQTIPVRFSVNRNERRDGRTNGGGDEDVFALDTPASRQASCADFSAIGPLQPLSTDGHGDIEHDSRDGRYTIEWKTSESWKGTCRTLLLVLRDGTTHQANFNFSK